MIKITPQIQIDENELEFTYIRSSGPGGQNVNKVATAVQLRFDASSSDSLASDIKGRLLRLAGKRANARGILTIVARRFRTQEQNREDAVDRFISLVKRASVPPQKRRKTKPTKSSQEKRLRLKRQHSDIKRQRQSRDFD